MSKKTLIAAAVGTAFAATLAAPVASAAGNPFELSALASGYQVADNHSATKPMEGKCGGAKKAGEGKCGAEGKCGHNKAKDGKCGEGKCGATGKDAKMKDGKCGEGKCGASKSKGDASKAEAGKTSSEK